MRFSRAALMTCCGGPLQRRPETTILVSATIRTGAFPPLAPCCVDLGLDLVLAHRRKIERGKLCHRLAEARRGGVARLALSSAQEIDEILDLRHPFGRQVLQLLDERLGVARVHGVLPLPNRRYGL